MDFTNKVYDYKCSMYECVKRVADEHPLTIAVVYEKKIFTYFDLMNMIDRYASFLGDKLHLVKGDVITISLPNIPQALFLLYAANKLGIICNMVHPFTPYNQLKAILDKVESKYAFLFEQRVAKEIDKYRAIQDKIYICRIEDYLPFFKKLAYHFFMNFKIRRKLGKHWKTKAYKNLYGKIPFKRNSTVVDSDGEGLALLLHSGSTTGEPKTIMIPSRAINFVGFKAQEEINYRSMKKAVGKGMISFLPSFHGFGLGMTMHLPLINGMHTILVPKFSPKAVTKALGFSNAFAICGVPSAYASLVKSEAFSKNLFIRNLEFCFSGGDALNQATIDGWKDIMKNMKGKSRLYTGFGLTETVAAVIVNTDGHHKKGALGYPLAGVEVKIVKENGQIAKTNEIGEICIKSPANMLGYFKDEEATKECMKDGFVYSGDLGYKDEEGFIFFVNRKKRVVKVSGVGVFPSEIEKLVETLPGVDRVVAISMPDPRLQSAIKLIVVSKLYDKEGLSQTIMEACQKYLIKWAVPKAIEYRDELPLTQYGKVNFRKLQEEEDSKYKK